MYVKQLKLETIVMVELIFIDNVSPGREDPRLLDNIQHQRHHNPPCYVC